MSSPPVSLSLPPALVSLSKALRAQTPLPQVLTLLAEQAKENLRCDEVRLVLKDGYLRHLMGQQAPIRLLAEDDSVSRWILEHRHALGFSERSGFSSELELTWPEADYAAFVGVPIQQGEETFGVLYALSTQGRSFDEASVALLETLAVLAALAIARQRLQARYEDGQRTLIRFALLDPLTNLASERQFDYLLRREWRRMHSDAMPLALIALEPDGFEAKEGRLGGAQAERELLHQLAKLLDAQLYRPNDLTARVSAKRFVMLLPATNVPGARAIAERVQRDARTLALGNPQRPGQRLTLSIGLAAHQPLEQESFLATPEELLAKAAEALRQAQAAGGDRIVSLA